MGVLVTIVSCISIVFFFFNKTVALALATFSLIFGIIEIIRRIVKKSSVILPLFSILMSLIPIILIIVSLFVPSVAKIGMKTSTTVDKYQTPYYGSWYNDETKTTVTFNKDKSYIIFGEDINTDCEKGSYTSKNTYNELHPEYEIATISSSKIVNGQETTESVITDYILSIENSLLTLTNKETSISYHFLKIE